MQNPKKFLVFENFVKFFYKIIFLFKLNYKLKIKSYKIKKLNNISIFKNFNKPKFNYNKAISIHSLYIM